MCVLGEDASTLTGGVLNNVHPPFYLASGVSDRLALFYRYRLGYFCGTPAYDGERFVLVERRSTQWSRGVCTFLRAACAVAIAFSVSCGRLDWKLSITCDV